MSHDEGFEKRPRIAHITNHGYAGVEVPYGGAPDTGGQNVYVNFIVHTMAELGYHVTVFTRGGFPFFESDRRREGIEPFGEHARYVYVPGGGDEFVRKEDIAVALDEEVDWIEAFIEREADELGCRPWEVYELVDAHYWDAGVIGMNLTRRWRARAGLELLAEVLGGVVSDETLEREQTMGSRSTAGIALEQVLGRLLLETTDALDTVDERVRDAVARWYGAKLPQRAALAAEGAWRAYRTAARETGPALASILGADVVGSAVINTWDPEGLRVESALSSTRRLVFTPHSLAVLKEENYRDRPLEVRRDLKFCERRDHETAVCGAARGFAATSTEIAERLRSHHGVPSERMFYFPAGIDRTLYREYSDAELEPVFEYLREKTGWDVEALREAIIVFETSRMDRTKRKDVLLDAFATAARSHPRAICLIGGGPENDVFRDLDGRRRADPVLSERAFLLGFIPDEMMYPLFSMAEVFVTPSEMEGFGLSAAQAAAVGTTLVASDLVPFALQYVPDEAIVVKAGDVPGFASAIDGLLSDPEDRAGRGRRLAEKTASLNWVEQTRSFLDHLRRGGLPVKEP